MFRVARLVMPVLLSAVLFSLYIASSYARTPAGRTEWPGQIQVRTPTEQTDKTFSPTTGELPAAASSVGDPELSSSPTALDVAIASAPSDAVIHLTSGDYSEITDFTARDGWVTISARGIEQRPQSLELISGGLTTYASWTSASQRRLA